MHIALPHDNYTSVDITSGKFSILFAADTADVSRNGHSSRSLSAADNVYLQIPTQDGKIPEHRRLHIGPCLAQEVAGWRVGDPFVRRYR